MKKELALCIATIGRPRAIRRLLRSIDKYVKAPHHTIILDNTYYYENDWNPIYKNQVDKLIKIDDRLIGCSESNNILARNCETRYLMHLDDDIYFDSSGVVEAELNRIKNSDADIVSCCWYDHLRGNYRPATNFWLIGIKDGRKCFKKMSLPYQAARQLNMDIIETKEALHSMIVDKNEVYDKGIWWDEDYQWKGDRESFFLRCERAGKKVEVLTDQIIQHDPIPFKYDSIKKVINREGVKEKFYDTYGIYPIANWDKYWGDIQNRKQ